MNPVNVYVKEGVCYGGLDCASHFVAARKFVVVWVLAGLLWVQFTLGEI